MEEYSNFIYKTKKYRYNLRLSLVSSDYIWDNIKQLLNQKDFSLVDNEEDTNFSEESVTDFISYLEQPDKNKINTKNVFAFKVLNEKYKVKNLQNQINEYIQNHRLDLIVLVIVDKNDITSDDIKLVVNRLFEFIDNRQLFLLPVNFIDQILQFYRSQQPDDSNENERKLMNFFIEYLKKQNEKGEQASLLFKHINFSKVGHECLSFIMSDCQNMFDFKYIPIEVVKILCSSYANNSQKSITKQMDFNYTGNVQSVVLEPGSYKLEAWGAQGGSFDSTFYGGYGGYSTGIINLHSKTTLYVVVGNSTNSKSGGYNGGGSGGVYTGSYTFTSFGGGGASHIGLKSGQLTDFSGDYSSNLLIVASGGGGATGTTHQSNKQFNSVGGCGGGIAGSQGHCSYDNSSKKRSSTGGTQNSGGKNNYSGWTESGSFGQGSNCAEHPNNHLGGGGGGGFYGGGSGGNSAGGAGGSGYINTSKLTDAFMYGYNAPTSSSAESKTYSTTNVSSDPISNYAKQNDGYVKITPV